jgi:hypothetical protein
MSDAISWATAPALTAFLLADVFAWSSAAKLGRLTDTAIALSRLGLTRRPQVEIAGSLAAVEALLAGLLVAGGVAASDALPLALGLSSLFLAAAALATARSLRRGDSFPCMCFGSMDHELSRWTLLRALVLCAVGVVAAVGAGSGEGTSLSVEAALVALSAWAGVLGILALVSTLDVLVGRMDPFDFSDEGSLIPHGLPVPEEQP